MAADINKIKSQVIKEVNKLADRAVEISHLIHGYREVAFEEYKSSELLAGELESHGFKVKRKYMKFPTAFRAEFPAGKRGRTIAFLSEYDALPSIGHACGHNIIGTAGTFAGIAASKALKGIKGRVVVLGTPAEETNGTKVDMAAGNTFNDIDAAMIVHPGGYTRVARSSMANYPLKVEFFGKSAHSAADPWEGINALDAVIMLFNGVSLLQKQLPDYSRVPGIITDGGKMANVVPDYAACRFSLRSATKKGVEEIADKVRAIARGAAKSIGARVKITRPETGYDPMISNMPMSRAFTRNLEQLKVPIDNVPENTLGGSIDMGNVSGVCPSIHPTISIGAGMVGHSPEFEKAACSPLGDKAMIQAAKAMAMTAVDIILDDALYKDIKKEFSRI